MRKSIRKIGMILLLPISFVGEAVLASSPSLIVRVQRNDYPPEVLASQLSGDIPIRLQISQNGEVRCEVTGKQGPAILRESSCTLVSRRWPFAPPLDTKGNPQSSSLNLTVKWAKMPDRRDAGDKNDNLGFGGATPISPENWLDTLYREQPSLAAYRGRDILIHFDVTTVGGMRNCLVEDRSQGALFTQLLCPVLERHALLLPAIDSDGHAVATKGTIGFTFG